MVIRSYSTSTNTTNLLGLYKVKRSRPHPQNHTNRYIVRYATLPGFLQFEGNSRSAAVSELCLRPLETKYWLARSVPKKVSSMLILLTIDYWSTIIVWRSSRGKVLILHLHRRAMRGSFSAGLREQLLRQQTSGPKTVFRAHSAGSLLFITSFAFLFLCSAHRFVFRVHVMDLFPCTLTYWLYLLLCVMPSSSVHLVVIWLSSVVITVLIFFVVGWASVLPHSHSVDT